MASVKAFMDMVKEFLGEMSNVFPERTKLQEEYEKIKNFTDDENEVFLEKFAKSMETCGKYITAKNPKIFKRGRSEFFDDIELFKIWKETTRKSVRGAIWNYLQTLQILASTISVLPKEMMTSIEQMAEECAAKLVKEGAGDNGQMDLSKIDMNALMQSVQGMMGNIKMPK